MDGEADQTEDRGGPSQTGRANPTSPLPGQASRRQDADGSRPKTPTPGETLPLARRPAPPIEAHALLRMSSPRLHQTRQHVVRQLSNGRPASPRHIGRPGYLNMPSLRDLRRRPRPRPQHSRRPRFCLRRMLRGLSPSDTTKARPMPRLQQNRQCRLVGQRPGRPPPT